MDKGKNGYIGEQYVLIELLRNNFEAYLPPSSTQNGWDILVRKNNKNLKIQVKLLDWSSKDNKSIRGKFHNKNFDYLAIVLMNFGKATRYRVLIIPSDRLKLKQTKYQKECIDVNSNILYSIPDNKGKSSITLTCYKNKCERSCINREYLNKWNLIK